MVVEGEGVQYNIRYTRTPLFIWGIYFPSFASSTRRRFTLTAYTIAVWRVPKTPVRATFNAAIWLPNGAGPGVGGQGDVYLNRKEINFGIRVLCTAQTKKYAHDVRYPPHL